MRWRPFSTFHFRTTLDEVFREEEWSRYGEPWIITFFELVGDTVWGATAAMLRQLLPWPSG
ncbi:MAG: hypothetical protein CM1200mP26_04740 [Acidimicrobiales bacterium]|nr:MAG: hypothetical protein CM1200mP26_04740 [Acidimicrobiales bacterium]